MRLKERKRKGIMEREGRKETKLGGEKGKKQASGQRNKEILL